MDFAAHPPLLAIWKGLAAALVLTALAACAQSPPAMYRAAEVTAPVHGDNRPHPAVARARGMPIQGMDVARYQGAVDFGKAHAAGVRFVYMKATEGADYLDPAFRQNWAKARAAGMAHGAYHFMAWCSTAAEQAK